MSRKSVSVHVKMDGIWEELGRELSKISNIKWIHQR